MISDRRAWTIEPYFFPGKKGQLFCTYFRAQENKNQTCVIYYPPFAEEMNKSRRIVAMQARSFAAHGIDVLLVDPYGTGDSAGEFSDASWEVWIEDYLLLIDLLINKNMRLIYWGLRLGALMALDVMRHLDAKVQRIIFWQPVTSGEGMITQFLRLRVAADINSSTKTTTKQLREHAKINGMVEVAGYELSRELIDAIDNKRIDNLSGSGMPALSWFEVSGTEGAALGLKSRQEIDRLIANGTSVIPEVIHCAPFWNSLEIVTNDELVTKTTRFLL